MNTHRVKRLLALATVAACGPLLAAAPVTKNILCTTFPIYQLTRHVVEGRDAVAVDLLLPAALGCPHDYALTPQDMQRLARAEVLIVNGHGMEEFLGAPLEKANARLVVIDSSAGIKDVLRYAGGGDHHGEGGEHDHGHGDAHGDGHHHHHSGVNPHLFASPRQAARLSLNIAAELSKLDPDGAAVYYRNAQAYSQRLNALADEFSALAKRLANNRIVQPHGVMDYLARDMGLEIVAVTQPHGQEPSAAEMLELVGTIRAKKAGAVFTEPQYSDKVGRTLAKETGVATVVFDPAASGPDKAPLDYYEKTMRTNLQTISTVLGAGK